MKSDSELTSGWSGEEGLVLVVGIPSSGELDVNLTQPRPPWWRFFSLRMKNGCWKPKYLIMMLKEGVGFENI
jgi:hypothetical protein